MHFCAREGAHKRHSDRQEQCVSSGFAVRQRVARHRVLAPAKLLSDVPPCLCRFRPQARRPAASVFSVFGPARSTQCCRAIVLGAGWAVLGCCDSTSSRASRRHRGSRRFWCRFVGRQVELCDTQAESEVSSRVSVAVRHRGARCVARPVAPPPLGDTSRALRPFLSP